MTRTTRRDSGTVPVVPVITGTVDTAEVTPSAVIPALDLSAPVPFTRPTKQDERRAVAHLMIDGLRALKAQEAGLTAGMLARLVGLLVLNPTSTTAPTGGGVVDVLTALGKGAGAIEFDKTKISQARNAHRILSALPKGSVPDSSSPKWRAILHATGKVGVSVEAIDAKVTGNGQRMLAAIEAIESAKGEAKDRAVREQFPSKRKSDGPLTSSKAWAQFDRAIKSAETAALMVPDAGGMTPDEREAGKVLAANLASLLSAPAPVKVPEVEAGSKGTRTSGQTGKASRHEIVAK